jgi:hypothetical protein
MYTIAPLMEHRDFDFFDSRRQIKHGEVCKAPGPQAIKNEREKT